MILIPATSFSQRATQRSLRLYQDSSDPKLVYVDALEPAPARGNEAVRWMPIPPDAAYLAGEVRFSAREEELQQAVPHQSGQRAMPVPWQSGPVFAWVREGDGVRLLARGKTSGYGAHNAVLSGSAPARLMISPLVIAAELSCRGKLAGGRVHGQGELAGVKQAMSRVPVGVRAVWTATTAEALLSTFKELIKRRMLTLVVEPVGLPAVAAEELQTLAFIEWAYRLAMACSPPLESLALPAVQAGQLARYAQELPLPDLRIEWADGSLIPVRTVRVLYQENLSSSQLL